jgi:antitoxin (DNA-binding transcriptional repressor) of toxin-antitoxin stability system
MKSMPASLFKARFLAVSDEVARTGEPVAVSKRGRTVVNIVRPQPTSRARSTQQALRASGRTRGDIVSLVLPAGNWDALAREELSRNWTVLLDTHVWRWIPGERRLSVAQQRQDERIIRSGLVATVG